MLLEGEEIDLNEGHFDGPSPGVRALVKELKASDSGVNQASLCRIPRDIHEMNRRGVYNQNTRAANYVGGELVDFESAMTEPHCILDGMGSIGATLRKGDDLGLFDNMVEEEGLERKVRALCEATFLGDEIWWILNTHC